MVQELLLRTQSDAVDAVEREIAVLQQRFEKHGASLPLTRRPALDMVVGYADHVLRPSPTVLPLPPALFLCVCARMRTGAIHVCVLACARARARARARALVCVCVSVTARASSLGMPTLHEFLPTFLN